MPETRVARRKCRRQSFTMQCKSLTVTICSSRTATAAMKKMPRLWPTRRKLKLRRLALWLQTKGPMELICKFKAMLKRHCWYSRRRTPSATFLRQALRILTQMRFSKKVNSLTTNHSALFSILEWLTLVRSKLESFNSNFWLPWIMKSSRSQTWVYSRSELVMLDIGSSEVIEKGFANMNLFDLDTASIWCRLVETTKDRRAQKLTERPVTANWPSSNRSVNFIKLRYQE